MKLKAASILLLTVVLSNSQPKALISIYGGYSFPAADLLGTFPQLINYDSSGNINPLLNDSNSYFTKRGYNIGLTFKFTVSPKAHIRLALSASYQHFSSSQSFLISNNNVLEASRIFEPVINILGLAVGPEYDFSPTKQFNTYLVTEVKLNFFSGHTHVNFHNALSNTTYDSMYEMNSTARLGIAVGGGVELDLGNIGLTAGLRYNIDNLLRKSTDTSQVFTRTTNRTYNLNDKEYTYRNERHRDKLIANFQLSAGFSYYFGENRKKKK